MEHRYSLRASCRIPARLQIENTCDLQATITNLSMDGLYLELYPELPGSDHPLSVNSTLQVHFVLPGNGGARPCTLDACVVHRNASGLGLMLRYTDPPTLRCLEALLQKPAPASPPIHGERACA
jgi:hypothetical protein